MVFHCSGDKQPSPIPVLFGARAPHAGIDHPLGTKK